MTTKELTELADRLADITEDAHGNPKPIDLSDRQEAARQLRQMAEVETKCSALREALQDIHLSPNYHGYYTNESGERITLSCNPESCAIAKTLKATL